MKYNNSKICTAILAALAAGAFTPSYANEEPTEVIQVKGIKSSLKEAAFRKQNATVVQESIVAEDIGKFPDQNVAESLQRITGVSISRVNGEGSQVSVRSFGPEFNMVKLNNRTLATTSGGRSFDFQLLPSELIAGADVKKSASADMAAGSIGAYINVRTARPLDSTGLHVTGAVKANQQSLAGDTNQEMFGLVSNSFADDTFGVLVGVSYKETSSRIDKYRSSHWNQFANGWGAYNPSVIANDEGGYDSAPGYGIPGYFDSSDLDHVYDSKGNLIVARDGNGEPVTDNQGNYLDSNGNVVAARGPGRSIFSMTDEERKRIGFNAVLQFAPSDEFEATVDLLHTKLERKHLGSGLQVPNQTANAYTSIMISDTGTLLAGTIRDTDVEMNVDYGNQESTTSAIGFNAVYRQDALTLEFDASYSKAKTDYEGDDTTALHYTRYTSATNEHGWNGETNTSLVTDDNGDPVYSLIAMDYSTDVPSMLVTGMDLTDISQVRAAWQRYAGYESEDEVKQVQFDALYEIDTGVVTSVKAGVAYEDRSISSVNLGTEFNAVTGAEDWDSAGMWIGDGATWGPSAATGILPAGVLELSASDYMDGISGVFPRQWVQVTDHDAYRAATQQMLEDMIEADPDGQGWRSGKVDAGWDTLHPSATGYVNDESTVSAYLQTNLEGELAGFVWNGNLGARYLSVDNTASGKASKIEELQLASGTVENGKYVSVDNTASTSAQAEVVKTSEEHFLPSANFSINFDNGIYLRTAAAKTITRPSLSDASVYYTEAPGLDAPIVAISGGNPYLKSYKVNQFDLSLEYYADNGDAYSVGYFYKDISNFISTVTKLGTWDGPVSSELMDAYADLNVNRIGYTSNRKENRPGGSVQGLEIGLLHHFDYLPGLLSGLGVQANYTYADSEDKDALPLNTPGVVEPGSGLEGFAKNSYNLIAFYDQDGFQARVAYNYRDAFLSSRSGDGISPEYNDDYGQVDVSVSYDITDNITIAMEAVNLTNETRLQYYGQRDRVSLGEMSGSRYQVGVRGRL